MKKIIKNIVLFIVKRTNLSRIILDVQNKKNIDSCNSQVTNNGGTFYPEAAVDNMQKNKDKIITPKRINSGVADKPPRFIILPKITKGAFACSQP